MKTNLWQWKADESLLGDGREEEWGGCRQRGSQAAQEKGVTKDHKYPLGNDDCSLDCRAAFRHAHLRQKALPDLHLSIPPNSGQRSPSYTLKSNTQYWILIIMPPSLPLLMWFPGTFHFLSLWPPNLVSYLIIPRLRSSIVTFPRSLLWLCLIFVRVTLCICILVPSSLLCNYLFHHWNVSSEGRSEFIYLWTLKA